MLQKLKQEYLAKTADFECEEIDMDLYKYFCAQVNVLNPSSLAGTMTLQVSNNLNEWVDIPDTETEISDSEILVFYDVVTGSSSIRIVADITAGTADFEIHYVLK